MKRSKAREAEMQDLLVRREHLKLRQRLIAAALKNSRDVLKYVDKEIDAVNRQINEAAIEPIAGEKKPEMPRSGPICLSDRNC